MSIFDRLGDVTEAKIIEPVRLFRALADRAEHYPTPRDIQKEVWERWFSRRDERDLILKMNTGSGKTVVGLLILQSSLNEGIGPAVYLVPDTPLQTQVIRTARDLGIRATEDFNDQKFRRGESILIVPVTTLVNGISRFGVRGDGKAVFNVGAIVFDDAHTSIPIIESQYSMRVSDEKIFKELRKLFADDLKSQSAASWQDIKDGTGSVAVSVPYWAWQQKIDSAAALLRGQANDSKNKFKWPLFREHLALCDAVFTPTEVEVTLPVPYLDAVPSFESAKRRIYMTATLADDSVLVSRLGADAETVIKPISPDYASDLGDRMILTPLQTSKQITADALRQSLSDFAKIHNVVVIVPSRYRAREWEDFTTEIHDAKTTSGCVERLQSGHVGLVVLIAKYDGIDLPGKACRILVLDGVPEQLSPRERAIAWSLSDTDDLRISKIQKIEQGMGRGVRAATDYAAVVLMDPRLTARLDRPEDLEVLSPGTRAQVLLSRDLEDVLAGQDISVFNQLVQGFLEREARWTTRAKAAIDALPYPEPTPVSEHVRAERRAFELVTRGNREDAANLLSEAVESVQDYMLRGWLRQRAASYLNFVNPDAARAWQNRALVENRFLSTPSLSVSSVPRITSNSQQAVASSEYLERHYKDARAFEVKIGAVLADLTPVPVAGTHKAFEAAVQSLGLILGFESQRPDNEFRIGPDNLWAIGGSAYLVIECKSEATASTISRSDLGQLSHSVDWFEERYLGVGATATPIMIHPSRTPATDAVARQGARFLTFEKLEELRDAVRRWAQSLAANSTYRDAGAVQRALSAQNLLGTQFVQTWTKTPK